MARKEVPLQTVTLPIICDALNEDETDGWIQMPRPGGYRLVAVRKVLVQLARLKGRDAELAEDVKAVREALSLRDPRAIAESVEKAGRWASTGRWKRTYNWSQSLAARVEFARFTYSYLLSLGMERARVVLWAPANGQKAPIPALYCPDDATASFALLATARVRLCANAKCKTPFVPANARTRFHTPQCGIAERQRRKRRRDAKAASVSSE